MMRGRSGEWAEMENDEREGARREEDGENGGEGGMMSEREGERTEERRAEIMETNAMLFNKSKNKTKTKT